MILGAYMSYGTGHHPAAWRMPGVKADSAVCIDTYKELAQLAEAAKFDFIFLADAPSVLKDDTSGRSGRVVQFEPLTLLAALASVTRHIGLIGTASTTYRHPYNLAREFASLDLISQGRAGWNMVTTSRIQAAGNFGFPEHPPHQDRYERATEFLSAVLKLWASWPDSNLPRDKISGQFSKSGSGQPIDHRGAYFSIKGPLDVPQSSQGHPLLVQAGASEAGQDLAAQHAELVFSAAQTMTQAQSFYRNLKSRLSRYHRKEHQLNILPGLSIYAGRTRAEAEDKLQALQDQLHPELGLSMLSDLVGGFDLSGYDPDGPLPQLPPTNQNSTKRQIVERLAFEEGYSIRQIYEHLAVARGHRTLIGSYEEIADEMIRWVDYGAADGFNLMPPVMKDDFKDFSLNILPILKERGYCQTDYAPGPLREKIKTKTNRCNYN